MPLDDAGDRPSASSWIVVSGLLAVILAYLPVFLLAGLGTFIRQDVGLSLVWIGIGTAGFFVASAIAAATVGLLCDRFGGAAVVKLGSTLSAIALVLMSFGTVWVGTLAIGLLIGGTANGFSQTAANVVLYRHIRHASQGRIFAIKQSAAPTVTLVAGIAISLFIPRFPWQTVVLGSAALFYLPAAVSWRWLPSDREITTARGRPGYRLRSEPGLIVLAGVSFLAFAASTAAVAYFVETLVSIEVDLEVAGRLLVAGSLAGVAARVLVGVVLDRFDLSPLTICFGMIAIGSLGYAVVLDVRSVPLLALTTVLIFGAGWGWPGLFVLGVVRSYPEKAAWASGMVQFGSALGAAFGPFLFGAASEAIGFRFAWWSSAIAMLVAAAGLYVRKRSLERDAVQTGSAP